MPTQCTAVSVVAAAVALLAASCGSNDDRSAKMGGASATKHGIIRIDGSSTVFPITQAVAEEYQAKHGGKVTIGVSGTGGGFKKFCRGEIVISGASRPIKPTEVELCAKNGIEYIELPVAYDGIAIVVHRDAAWIDSITRDELAAMWAPAAQNKITKWSQVRTGWPDKALHLFGPGVDSGTYDYFTKAIVGQEHASRGDFTASEDDNVLVQGISTDTSALGFFGYAYYAENKDRLKLVPVDDGRDDNGAGAIAPTPETVANGTYQPLSRPIFIYVGKAALERPEVARFVEFYLTEGGALAQDVGYIPLPAAAYDLAMRRFEARTTGSVFEGGSKVGVTVEQLLRGS